MLLHILLISNQLQSTRRMLTVIELLLFTLALGLLPLPGRLAQSPRLPARNGLSSSVISIFFQIFLTGYICINRLTAASIDFGLHLLTKSSSASERIFPFGGGLSGHHGKVNDMVFCGGWNQDTARYVATVSGRFFHLRTRTLIKTVL